MLLRRASVNLSHFLLAAVVLAAVVAVGVVPDASAQTSSSITWSNARVSVAATDTPLSAILRELAQRTGSRIVGLEQATERVTVDIRDAHLIDALRTLLAEVRVNYLYVLRPAPTADADRVTLWLYGPSSRPASLRAFQTEVVDAGDPGLVEPALVTAPPTAAADNDDVSRLHREGAFGATATAASLMGLAKSANHDVRILALQSLALQSTPLGIETIRAALKDEHPFVRAEAMDLLISQSPGVAAVTRLGELTAHEDPVVRGVAAMALGEQAGDDAQLMLERALEDGDDAVRGFAARALQQKRATEKPKR